MNIAASKDYITSKYPWCINEDTFQVLDAEYCLWIARVTTTHRQTPQDELTFPILVSEHEVFAELSNCNLQALGGWCLKQSAANSNDCSRSTQVEQ